MKLLSMQVMGHKVKPIYVNPLVGLALPFSHKRVDIIAGSEFKAKAENGRTKIMVKLGAGASDQENEFRVDFSKQVHEAFNMLRVAARARVLQCKATGSES